jgi:hypothetical protein
VGCFEEAGSDGADGVSVEAIPIPSAGGSPGGPAGGGRMPRAPMAGVLDTRAHIRRREERPTTGWADAIPGGRREELRNRGKRR